MLDQYEFYHYLPVNDDAMDWGLYVTGAGRGRIPARQSYPPPGHPSLYQFDWRRGRTLPEFQIILITAGKGVFESEPTGRRTIEPDTLILLFPGVWHRYRPDPATGWQERWISLNGEIIHRLVDQQLVRPAEAVCRPSDMSQIAQRFDLLLDRIHGRPAENTIQLSLRATDLIAEVIEQAGGPGPQTAGVPEAYGLQPPASPCPRQSTVEDPLVAQALDLIWTHSHRPLSVSHLVAHLPVTRRTLERRFALERGHSILDEINQCRAGRARRLLRETDLPIKTVAYLAGFTSQERMRITFRHQDECSPAEYRRWARMSQNKGTSQP
ncbi:MAG TPA: AraC family transcriptional regulator [Planctomycetaceae bacterium]|nr:AraC family transcriptional regulator [Planctomycetaceae bacterium]